MDKNQLNCILRLKDNFNVLKEIYRGIEKEGIRVNSLGEISDRLHPKSLGSALTHKWITTDFSEVIIEFITPVNKSIEYILLSLKDMHIHSINKIKNEYIWPMSMPCFIDKKKPIKLAQYGNSNIGRMKTIYRKGLKNRYSPLMQMITGIHYNFSLPVKFWNSIFYKIEDKKINSNIISDGYLNIIRNYYRFGWIISYLFGASPGSCSSFFLDNEYILPMKKTNNDLLYLPYATSLRLSNLGYTNKQRKYLNITFNRLDEYVYNIKKAVNTPYYDYQKIGLQRDGKYLQLNTNLLQNENELYIPIRPKRITNNNESLLNSLIKKGIEYIEIRSLDINPYSPIGINKEQIRFLDIFLIWCAISSSPKISRNDLYIIYENWNRITLEGRKPGLKIISYINGSELPLYEFVENLFEELYQISEIFDLAYKNNDYEKVCNKLKICFNNPELTLSSRLLSHLMIYGINELGMDLARKYKKIFKKDKLQVLNESQFSKEYYYSLIKQKSIEIEDNISFNEFITNLNKDTRKKF